MRQRELNSVLTVVVSVFISTVGHWLNVNYVYICINLDIPFFFWTLFLLGCFVGALGAWLRELNFKRGIVKRWWMMLLGGFSSMFLYIFYAFAMTCGIDSYFLAILLFSGVVLILAFLVFAIDRRIKKRSYRMSEK